LLTIQIQSEKSENQAAKPIKNCDSSLSPTQIQKAVVEVLTGAGKRRSALGDSFKDNKNGIG